MNTQRIPDLIEYVELLKRHDLKATPQRVAVHEAMIKLVHASADMVAEEISLDGRTKVTTSSVYNILTDMSRLGIYSRRMSSNNKMYFDACTVRHIHVYDSENNVYKDVMDDDLLARIEEKLRHKRFRGYTVEDIDIQIVVRPTKRRRP